VIPISKAAVNKTHPVAVAVTTMTMKQKRMNQHHHHPKSATVMMKLTKSPTL
jgi:hypothetical protein